MYTEQEVREHFEQETRRRPAQAVKYPSLDDYDKGVGTRTQEQEVETWD